MANCEEMLAEGLKASMNINETKESQIKQSEIKSSENSDNPEKVALEDENSSDEDEELNKENEEELSEEEKQRRKEEALGFKTEGNEHYKEERFSEALRSYKHALKVCPLVFTNDRAVLHSNRAACLQHLEKNEDAIKECTKALELNETYIKARLRRASLFEANDQLDEALEDYKKIVECEPLHRDALNKSRELPFRIQERNEKLKTEMLGKLKDLGNLVLRPFGLSTDNFKVQQDPNSGGYSINFQQNK